MLVIELEAILFCLVTLKIPLTTSVVRQQRFNRQSDNSRLFLHPVFYSTSQCDKISQYLKYIILLHNMHITFWFITEMNMQKETVIQHSTVLKHSVYFKKQSTSSSYSDAWWM